MYFFYINFNCSKNDKETFEDENNMEHIIIDEPATDRSPENEVDDDLEDPSESKVVMIKKMGIHTKKRVQVRPIQSRHNNG